MGGRSLRHVQGGGARGVGFTEARGGGGVEGEGDGGEVGGGFEVVRGGFGKDLRWRKMIVGCIEDADWKASGHV
jgi:hypothetical protein